MTGDSIGPFLSAAAALGLAAAAIWFLVRTRLAERRFARNPDPACPLRQDCAAELDRAASHRPDADQDLLAGWHAGPCPMEQSGADGGVYKCRLLARPVVAPLRPGFEDPDPS